MTCFNHSKKDSVGSCKSCGRALCHACIAPGLDSIACKNRCENQVQALDGFLNKAVMNKYSTTVVGQAAVTVMMAGLSVLFWNLELPGFAVFLLVLTVILGFNTYRYYNKK
ncbi:hypothetical protein [Candidatus Nucleicultrix amoebiphila]|jgi:hypothetical protein|uniref:hypothetical protein n=1 Tax=Candidatus Nucleicultrix amoebiphila TaxID=1509244 RepID=UPI0012F4916C|nr:hypothetical protein [Candidatus Nucleicultrix amoebiphila]